MKTFTWIGSILAISLISMMLYSSISKEKVSEQFAEHLFDYPLPAETSLIAKHQFNGKNFSGLGGSGGYWVVVAIMEMTSTLTKDEILAYYKNIELFPYPKSENRGVELEIYFEDDRRKVEDAKGFYYQNQNLSSSRISSYLLNSADDQINQATGETKYVIQLISGFDYFLNMD
ncbi:hypothetical protein I6N90_01710 [Paenibacillus sp. GSMTC-2017]|uniref:hypothetical protein n=1 Tax=Paenibacillus sp. GSMTC-2017 TaxID=2794350 RepID=UPI0018D974FE|nr:hypothetical protein [Paenibacillus sp. GSMTC-2017]MBH5316521.1 hypothetical protein [Paenibacillus sp. GSMTC-2017]